MSNFNTARRIYADLQDDPVALDRIRAACKSMSEGITDPNGFAMVTSGTMNGQSFAMFQQFKPSDRHAIMRLVVRMADNCIIPSTQTVPYL